MSNQDNNGPKVLAWRPRSRPVFNLSGIELSTEITVRTSAKSNRQQSDQDLFRIEPYMFPGNQNLSAPEIKRHSDNLLKLVRDAGEELIARVLPVQSCTKYYKSPMKDEESCENLTSLTSAVDKVTVIDREKRALEILSAPQSNTDVSLHLTISKNLYGDLRAEANPRHIRAYGLIEPDRIMSRVLIDLTPSDNRIVPEQFRILPIRVLHALYKPYKPHSHLKS